MNELKKQDGRAPGSDILVYQAEDGTIKLEVRLEDETLWLTQQMMADLFQTSKQNISLHIQNIYAEGELFPGSTVKNFLTVRLEGNREVKRELDYYNLDVIISVGYRVKSILATRFRIWATQRLREYIIKGFVMDDERLKNPLTKDSPVPDYFDELLERLRDIRSSEKRFYQKVRDIYATAVDYDKKSRDAQTFFKKVQNKMLWSVTGKTAAELIASRSDPQKPNMGLTSWRGAKVRKGDVSIAKHYLEAKELGELNRIVTMYLDYAEDQANRRQALNMKQWADKLDAFLRFNNRDLLTHAGKVNAEVAKKLAEGRYEEFAANRLEDEARQADAEDLQEIEALIRELGKKGRGNE